MANTEQIEAKLCAYVDGELDAAGRAEIEAHLAANPQHRELLTELMAQRELLRELPREPSIHLGGDAAVETSCGEGATATFACPLYVHCKARTAITTHAANDKPAMMGSAGLPCGDCGLVPAEGESGLAEGKTATGGE